MLSNTHRPLHGSSITQDAAGATVGASAKERSVLFLQHRHQRLGHARPLFLVVAALAVGIGCVASGKAPDAQPRTEITETPAAVAGANLGGANLAGTNLAGTNLAGTNLGAMNLGGTNLAGTNLAGTNLAGTNLGGNNLGGNNLAGTNLAG